jgi:hypothetical protein
LLSYSIIHSMSITEKTQQLSLKERTYKLTGSAIRKSPLLAGAGFAALSAMHADIPSAIAAEPIPNSDPTKCRIIEGTRVQRFIDGNGNHRYDAGERITGDAPNVYVEVSDKTNRSIATFFTTADGRGHLPDLAPDKKSWTQNFSGNGPTSLDLTAPTSSREGNTVPLHVKVNNVDYPFVATCNTSDIMQAYIEQTQGPAAAPKPGNGNVGGAPIAPRPGGGITLPQNPAPTIELEKLAIGTVVVAAIAGGLLLASREVSRRRTRRTAAPTTTVNVPPTPNTPTNVNVAQTPNTPGNVNIQTTPNNVRTQIDQAVQRLQNQIRGLQQQQAQLLINAELGRIMADDVANGRQRTFDQQLSDAENAVNTQIQPGTRQTPAAQQPPRRPRTPRAAAAPVQVNNQPGATVNVAPNTPANPNNVQAVMGRLQQAINNIPTRNARQAMLRTIDEIKEDERQATGQRPAQTTIAHIDEAEQRLQNRLNQRSAIGRFFNVV